MQHQKEIALQGKHDALPQPPETGHPPAFRLCNGWRHGAQHERAGEANALQRLIHDLPLQAFDVNDDIGEFRHDAVRLRREIAP